MLVIKIIHTFSNNLYWFNLLVRLSVHCTVKSFGIERNKVPARARERVGAVVAFEKMLSRDELSLYLVYGRTTK